MDLNYKIKKKPMTEKKVNSSPSNKKRNDPSFIRRDRKKRLKLPASDMQNIFENILNEANRDETIYRTLCSIINLANKELVCLIR